MYLAKKDYLVGWFKQTYGLEGCVKSMIIREIIRELYLNITVAYEYIIAYISRNVEYWNAFKSESMKM